MDTVTTSTLSASPPQISNFCCLHLMTILYNSGMLMVATSDLPIEAMMLLSPWMGPYLFHGGNRLLQFGTWILGQLLNSRCLSVPPLSVAVSPPTANLWQVVLCLPFLDGISPAQVLIPSRNLLDMLRGFLPLYSPPPSSQHPEMVQSGSGNFNLTNRPSCN